MRNDGILPNNNRNVNRSADVIDISDGEEDEEDSEPPQENDYLPPPT